MLKLGVCMMILSMIGQVIASILAGSLRHMGLLLLLDIVVGIFLLNEDEDFRPVYTAMVGTLFQPCAEQCPGGLNCLCNFVVLNSASFFMGVLFSVPGAFFEVAIAFDMLPLPAPDHQVTNATAVPQTGVQDMQRHLTQLQRAAIVLDAICMLLANLAQCVCSVQGARVLSDMANGRSSQAISTFSDDDLLNPGNGSYTAWRLNRGARMHHAAMDGLQRAAPLNGGTAPASASTTNEVTGNSGGTSSNTGHQQGRTFQSFTGVGYRLE